MTRLFARHAVNDYSTWRAAYDDFDSERKEMGVRAHSVFQDADNPNMVTIMHDFDSVESAQSFSGSARLKEVMKEAGVAGPPEIWLATAAD